MDDVIYSFLNVEYRCLHSHPPLRPHIELTIKETPMLTFFLISEGSISWSFGLAILACVLFFLSIIFIVLSRSRESRMRENRKSYKRNTRPMSRPDEELKSGSFYDGASMQGSRPSSVYSIGQHSNRGYAAWIFVDIKMCVLGNWQDVVRKVSQESMGNLTHSKLQFLLMLQ